MKHLLCLLLFTTAVLAGTNQQIISTEIPLTLTNGTIGIPQAGASTSGFLSSTDWNAFHSGAGGGSVTSVDVTVPSWLTATGGPITITGTIAITGTSESQNLFLASPNGSSGAMTPRLIVGADLPNPSSSTLGGVRSAVSVSHQWINSISTSGVPSLSQPAFSDISGSVGASQLPNPTSTTLGGIESIVSASNNWIAYIDTSGVPHQSQPSFTNISGSVAASQLPNPTSSTLGGVESYAAVTNQWINAISTSGVPSSAQPAFTNLSGSLAGSQLPTFTGDVTNSSAAMTVAKVAGTTVSGTTGTGNVVFSASPTITGTAVLASASFSGSVKSGNCYISPAETDIGNAGTTQSIDLSSGNVWTANLNASTTWTFSNPTAGCPYVFILTQTNGGSHTFTPAGVTTLWGNSGAHTLSTAANAVDKVSCVYNVNITSLLCDLSVAYQ